MGIDVPNAVIMLIENAERFGLAQLHQLRGRVGRGEHRSYCILVSDAKSESEQKRIKTMVSTCDGFEISREDLRQRGPGDFFGLRQHGLPQLQTASLEKDTQTLLIAQKEARELLEHDPKLCLSENSGLKSAMDQFFVNVQC